MTTGGAGLLAVAALGLAGCSFEPAAWPLPPTGDPDDTAVLLDGACAPRDARIGALGARLHALSDRSGYYAGREMAAAAKDRDELVLRIVAREEAVARCAEEGPALARRRLLMALLLGALVEGRDPYDWRSNLGAFDWRLRPMWMPLAHRVCSGTGFEGAAECFTFGPLGAIADVVTFPLGTWIWAAKDAQERVWLGSYPPSDRVRAATLHVEALRRQARAGHVTPRRERP